MFALHLQWLLLTGLMLPPSVAPPALGWQVEASMPSPRAGFGIVQHGGLTYVISGGNLVSSTQVSYADVWAYDGVTWSVVTTFPGVARASLSAVSLGGFIYVVGGFVPNGDDTAEVWRYNASTNVWDQRTSMPAPRSNGGVVARDGKIYVLGGRSWEPGWVYHNTVFIYDPTLDYPGAPSGPWSEGISHPGRGPAPHGDGYPLGDNSAIGVDGRILVVGGNSGTAGFSDNYDEIWLFDPFASSVERAWRLAGHLPQPLAGPHLENLYGHVVALGGSQAWDGVGYKASAKIYFLEVGYSVQVTRASQLIDSPVSTSVMDGRLYTICSVPEGSWGAAASGDCFSFLP